MAALLLAHLLAVLVLAACPRWHHWAHPDADGDDHDCAVVGLLHGGSDAAPGPAALPVLAEVRAVVSASALPTDFVPSVFAENRVFEHAPPRRGCR